MKTTGVFLAILIVLIPVASLGAQQQEVEQDTLFAITVQIQRVYPHHLGFKVVYDRSDLYPGEVYLPGRWFTVAAGRAELLYTSHPSAPYMTVFYRNGEFSHLRLVAQSNRSHRSWGALPSGADLREAFASDELVIRY